MTLPSEPIEVPRVVHKFWLLAGSTGVAMDPRGKWLHVEPQGDALCLWAEVDPIAEKRRVPVYLVMTGQEVPAGCRHFATALLENGAIVVHVYRPTKTCATMGHEAIAAARMIVLADAADLGPIPYCRDCADGLIRSGDRDYGAAL